MDFTNGSYVRIERAGNVHPDAFFISKKLLNPLGERYLAVKDVKLSKSSEYNK